MASKEVQVTSNGIGFWGILLLILITLKLAGLAEISWLAIGLVALCPIVLFLIFLAISVGLVGGGAAVAAAFLDRK